ncbi:DUF4037 domain-containing protein [Flexivirga sp. ID2601S]|uniref:DUF4037 domain-containing protein n=1 Tax=Flexivirga aerilata TaxID=1656889 RepID=A0A849AJM0_9MICO|nr:DUF4037 domain-containing protein [Flexivirga aerilata]NNG40615.1 DUF4037 domain-containing protein [Flexivirga aerilata]
MPDFVPGRTLSRMLYDEAVAPLLFRHLPGLPHAAALLGGGSEVLGFDTARSTDHDWGPRLQLFLTPRDLARHGGRLHEVLDQHLPPHVAGWPIDLAHRRASRTPAPDAPRHGVEVTTLGDWLTAALGFDPRDSVSVLRWLSMPTQRLAEVTGGAVHHDDTGELGRVRTALAWYPDDVWRYVLAAGWDRVGQDEHLMARAGEVGDALGASVIAARIVRDLMQLALLMERRYPPYAKWLGSAVAALPGSAGLHGQLLATVRAGDPAEREREYLLAATHLAQRHNELGITPPVDPAPRAFHDRPFRVLGADRFATALLASIGDPAVRQLRPVGNLSQLSDNTQVLVHAARYLPITEAALS